MHKKKLKLARLLLSIKFNCSNFGFFCELREYSSLSNRFSSRLNKAFAKYRSRVYRDPQPQGSPARGNKEFPEMWKDCCRKMVLFSQALFIATTFPNRVKFSIFQLNFHQRFSRCSQNFPNQLCFSSKRTKILGKDFKFF